MPTLSRHARQLSFLAVIIRSNHPVLFFQLPCFHLHFLAHLPLPLSLICLNPSKISVLTRSVQTYQHNWAVPMKMFAFVVSLTIFLLAPLWVTGLNLSIKNGLWMALHENVTHQQYGWLQMISWCTLSLHAQIVAVTQHVASLKAFD